MNVILQMSLKYYQKLIEADLVDKFVFYRIKKNDKRIDFLKKNKINFVTWGRSSTKDNYAWIDLDNEKSIEILMQRLYDFGHRKIGFLNVHQSFNYGFQRKEAYEKLYEAHKSVLEATEKLPIEHDKAV